MKKNSMSFYDSPPGRIAIIEDGTAITELYFTTETGAGGAQDAVLEETPLLKEAVVQLQEYFSGKRQQFTLPLALKGTAFQRRVWQALQEIPYGQTRSYGQIASAIGNAKACRAVGLANSKNPVSIIVPCHRVIGASGKLVGYGGGLDRKTYLLDLEKQNCMHSPSS